MLKLNYALGTLECAYINFNKPPFRPTTVQMPNLALIEKKKTDYSVVLRLQSKKPRGLKNTVNSFFSLIPTLTVSMDIFSVETLLCVPAVNKYI